MILMMILMMMTTELLFCDELLQNTDLTDWRHLTQY